MNLSIVVPLYNEVESIVELKDWVSRVVAKMNIAYEIIFIDDGSNDGSWGLVEEMAAAHKEVLGIKFRRNYGKSAALFSGFKAANGDVVITMDADLQDNPDEIPALYNMIAEEEYDLVSGWKQKRHDPIGKTLPSKLFNRTARVISGIKLHDFNCGLKAYKKDVVKNIEVYGEMHRYIPILAKRSGFNNITEKVVIHRERQYGVSKFGMERFLKGFLDLLSVSFISKFGKKPMHLFGGLGTLMFLVGFIASSYLGINKLYHVYHGIKMQLITTSPYFYIALTSMVIGSQLFLAGFLAELVSRNSPDRNQYHIEKEVNL